MMVSRPLRALLLTASLTLSLLVGCKGAPAFICESSDECNPGGTCEGTGFCSFPDTGCSSGSRYGGYAGDGLSDTCVGEAGDVDARNPGADGGFFDAPGPAGDARSGGCIDVGGGTCLALPTQEIMGGVEGVAPDLTCPPYPPGLAAAAVPYSGLIRDPFTGTGVAAASIQWFEDQPLTDLAVEALGNATGNYSTTFPAGTTGPLQVRITASGRIETLFWNHSHKLNPAGGSVVRDYKVFSNSNLSTVAAEAGTTHTPGVDVVYGFAYDCAGDMLYNALAVLSSTSSKTGNLPTVVPGTLANYNGRPRTERTSTDEEGTFYFFRVPPIPAGTTRYLQVWGYLSRVDVARGAYGMTLISELPIPSRAGSLISVEAHHTEGPLN